MNIYLYVTFVMAGRRVMKFSGFFRGNRVGDMLQRSTTTATTVCHTIGLHWVPWILWKCEQLSLVLAASSGYGRHDQWKKAEESILKVCCIQCTWRINNENKYSVVYLFIIRKIIWFISHTCSTTHRRY